MMGYYDGSMKISRNDMANTLRDIAEGVEDGSYESADPELRDTLLSIVDDLYCTSFTDEDECDEDCDEDDDE